MQSEHKGLSLKYQMSILLLVPFYLYVAVVNGFFVKNCDIKGSSGTPDNPKALCSKKNLNTVPENLPDQARVLDISHNNISRIKNNDLAHLSYLKHLNASHNVLQKVEDGTFESLAALQELNLAFNRLTIIQGGLFQNLTNLTLLHLEENFIESFSASVFSPLRSLIMVNLSGNHLHNLQELQSLFTLPNIRNVYIMKNGFKSFQTSEISNTSLNLKVLGLSQNPLEVFRMTADVFPQLELLDLAFINRNMKWDVQDKNYLQNVKRLNLSGIQMVTEQISTMLQMFNSSLFNLRLYHLGVKKVKPLIKVACQIKSLTVLRLEENNINYLSDQDLKLCKQLMVLDLGQNKLLNISKLAFSSLNQLTTLSLCHNKLQSVPDAIRNLSTLQILDLSYNNIRTIRCSDFANLINLTQLHIYRNPLFSLENCVFQTLNNLKELKMGSNIISIFSFSKGLMKLGVLELAQNKLNAVHKGDFGCLQSLTYLFLQDNQITHLESGAFEGLNNLVFLNLQSNRITQTSIKSSVFSGLSKLTYLLLNNNYISYSTQGKLDDPPFALLTYLDTLFLYSQGKEGMSNIPLNLLEGLTNLHVLWAGNLNIKSLHPDTFTYTPKLNFLDLSKNELTSLSPEIFKPLKQLCRLMMIKTSIQSLDFLEANLTEIKMLFLRQNAITVINKTSIKSVSKLMYLDLEQNAFLCDCSNAWFINWTKHNKDTQVINADTFSCNYPSNLRGEKLMDLDVNTCNVDVGFVCFVSTTSLVLLTLLSSFLYHFLKLHVVYTYYLLLAFLYDSKHQRKRNGFLYDAFVSYNTHDELWVMRELLPQLEGQQGWRLCLHHRDFQPGKPILDNIVDGIYSSRKTICVISRHYLESEWCSREIQVASFRLFDEKNDVLILVFLEDIPAHQLSPYYRMRSLIKKRTYLTWPKQDKDTQIFWEKLRKALETNQNTE